MTPSDEIAEALAEWLQLYAGRSGKLEPENPQVLVEMLGTVADWENEDRSAGPGTRVFDHDEFVQRRDERGQVAITFLYRLYGGVVDARDIRRGLGAL